MVAEGSRDLVADDVAQHAAEHRGHDSHQHRHQGWHAVRAGQIDADRSEQAQPERIGQLDDFFGWLEMSPSHEHHGRRAQCQHAPQVFDMPDPEEGPQVEQDVAQGAAAECGQEGHRIDADGVEPAARRGHDSRQREGDGG